MARTHELTALGDEHFNNSTVIKHLSYLHAKYVVASAYKAPSNICVTKSHYIDCLIKELGIDNSLGNSIYTPDRTNERVNPGQSKVCFVFLWNFIQR